MRLHRLLFPFACLLLAHTTSLARVDKERLRAYKVAKRHYAAPATQQLRLH